MEVSQLWSVLYFFMLLMLGIGSMLGNTAAILTPLTDSKAISRHLPKEAISGERRAGRRRDSGRADGGDQQVDGLLGGHVPVEVATELQQPHRSPAFTVSSPWAGGMCQSPHASGSPPQGDGKWPPRLWEKAKLPNPAPRAPRPGETLLLSLFNGGITAGACTFLKHKLNELDVCVHPPK